MQRVHAGHGEVEEHEEFNVRERSVEALNLRQGGGLRSEINPWHQVFEVVVAPFKRQLDADESQAQEHGRDQEDYERLAPAELSGMHGERHGQAAEDQDPRVRSAKPYVEKMTSGHKSGQIEVAINRIAAEEAAEEQDLRCQEHPHSQARGVVLLFGIVELFG